MRILKLRTVLLVLLASNIFCLPVLAANDTQLNPYIPHTYLNGYIGDGGVGNFIGRADILAPLYTTNDKDLFVYAQGFMGDKTYDSASNVWQLSAGAGYRQIIGSRIYGAYLFGDYVGTEENNEFWMISPGIESLGEIIDFRVNGYFPAGTDKWTKDSTPVFVSHETNYDLYQYYTDTESVGPGGDAEIGAKLFSIDHMPFKLFLDGYAFYPEDIDHILGIGGRVTFQPTRYLTLEARYTYDNENHNVFMGGIRLYLNGFAYGLENNHVDDIGIQPRLYDQIERNFAAGSVGSAAATSDKLVPNGGPQPSDYYSVYVINDETYGDLSTSEDPGLTGDGTLENPYIYTSPDDMQDILDKTATRYNPDTTVVRIYYTSPSSAPFQMPTYDEEDLDGSYVSPYTNQQIWGTTGYDWAIPSTPDTYAVSFVGGFSLEDVSNVQFHYLNMENYISSPKYETGINYGNPFPNAIDITNSQNIVLQSVQIGYDPITGYLVGIAMQDYSSITLNNAKIYGQTPSSTSYDGIGMTVKNGGTITAINNSLVEGEYTGVELLGNTENHIIMGDIIGDQTSTFEGSWAGMEAEQSSSPIITIGNISGVNFTGYYGLSVYSPLGSVTIGDIINSTFEGRSNVNSSRGLTIWATYLTMGNITNSAFEGRAIGFSVSASASGSIISIGDITGSVFTGTDFGLALRSNSSTGSVTIKSLKQSTLSENGGYAALELEGSSIEIGSLTSTSATDIYNYLSTPIYGNNFNAVTNKVCTFSGVTTTCV